MVRVAWLGLALATLVLLACEASGPNRDTTDAGATSSATGLLRTTASVSTWHSRELQGSYDNRVECCLSGNDVDASSARTTLTTESEARVALKWCLGAMAKHNH